MRIRTSKLTGAQLDWAVAVCEGRVYGARGTCYEFTPSCRWAQGGPIIEQEKIDTQYDWDWEYDPTEPEDTDERWLAELPLTSLESGYSAYGPTPLIAAMRAYVASKLGDEIEIPDELKA